MALANMGFKDQNWSHFGKEKKREGGEEEKRKRKKRRSRPTRYGTIWFCMELWIFGMETTLGMDFVWITWNFKVLYG